MRSALLLTFALAGCASTNAVLSRTPLAVIHSARSAEDVVFCLQDKIGAPAMERDGAKVVLAKSPLGATLASFTVRPEGSGSTVTIQKGSQPITPRFKRCY